MLPKYHNTSIISGIWEWNTMAGGKGGIALPYMLIDLLR